MFCVLKLKSIKIVLAICLVAVFLAISFNGVSSAQVYFGYSTRLVPVYSVQTEEKKIAISFDAAWGADKTEKIMEILKEYNADATFFLTGFWVDDNAELVKKISDNGYDIGGHSNTHADLTKLSKDAMELEITSCNEKITAITNKSVNLFRPPYGAYNNTLIKCLEKLEILPVQWSIDSLDWKGKSAIDITTKVINNAKNGSIVLFHNNSDNILDALPMVLDRLTKNGYEITSVSNLVYNDNYVIDMAGVQKLKS